MGDEIKLGAYAVTEAGAGSDVKSLRTTAKLDGDEWVLNGTKVFISNGGIADVTVVVATVDPELGHRGQASFVVPKGTPGLSQGKKEDKLGIRASQTAEVVLEDCRIPVDYLLGGMDKLNKKLERARSGQSTGRSSGALATFEITRPLVGASALGIAQAAYEWTLEYLEDKEEDGAAAAGAAAHPAGARRRGHRDRGRAPARLARRLDGPQRHPDDRRPGLDVEAEGGRRGDVGHDHADGPRRARSRRPRTARSRSGSATPRSTRSSRARPRCSGWSSRACSARPTRAAARGVRGRDGGRRQAGRGRRGVSETAPGPTVSKRNKITIEVDRDLCFGFGDCVDSAPGVFELDDENKSIIVDPDAQDRDTIMLASQDCPVDAIFIVDEESGEQIYP